MECDTFYLEFEGDFRNDQLLSSLPSDSGFGVGQINWQSSDIDFITGYVVKFKGFKYRSLRIHYSDFIHSVTIVCHLVFKIICIV